MTQRSLDLRPRFPPWAKTAYIQRLEVKLMLTRAALVDECRLRERLERKLARRWAERPNQF